ncbi:11631_t:CDS:1 [Ambispora leptoticha]|uniref:11631_t:CDS:1 n=1 Tax=Ambispora leptoticha TaxID=144679 RepID=A0A9N9FBG5_9GLOM|nr:11631_t:CDS:1 [Ambispora leptoticha]
MDYRVRGNEAVKRGDYLTAYHEYNKGLIESPKDPTLWCNRAYVFLKLGYPELTLMDTKRVSNILAAEINFSSAQSDTHQILGFKAAYRQGEAYTQLKLYKLAINKYNGLLMSLSMNLLNENVQVDRVSLETKRDFCVEQDKKLSTEFKNYQKFGGDAGEFQFNVGYMWDTRPASRGAETTRQTLHKIVKSISFKELKLDRIDFQESEHESSSIGNGTNNNGDGKKDNERSQIQFGVFSESFIEAGEIIFQEDSFLCAHNHFTSRCDYCNRPLPPEQEIITCDNDLCQEIFCSTQCYSLALAKYHGQLCGKDIGNILQGTRKGMSNSTLAYLLVLKVFAVAKTRSVHPLDISEMTHLLRYQLPSELGLSFNANWTQIYQETLDILGISVYDLQFDFWVYVTCLTTLGCNIFGGKDKHGRPDTASLFPHLATFINHSCDPNVEHKNGVVDSCFWSRHVFRARKCIQAGEQIFISYVNTNFCKKDRTANLAYYGFKCSCQRCKDEL